MARDGTDLSPSSLIGLGPLGARCCIFGVAKSMVSAWIGIFARELSMDSKQGRRTQVASTRVIEAKQNNKKQNYTPCQYHSIGYVFTHTNHYTMGCNPMPSNAARSVMAKMDSTIGQ